ncbi:MAG: peptide/nickel transport system substrate-binding protein [Solirubrobacteraceae bacterium]|nr:peptide/nickel transport system substrate-binding protein [Solirubrobacteraceae bacterium]
MSRRGVITVAAIAVVIGAIVVFAGGSSGGGDKASSGAAKNDTLVVLGSDIPNGLDVDGSASSQVVTAEVISNLYDTEVFYPVKEESEGILLPDYKVAQTGYVPWMTTPAKKTAKSWDVTIADNVKSCTGSTMTADDLHWSLARAKSATSSSNISWFAGYASNIWGLEPVLPDATKKDKTLTDAEVKQVSATQLTVNQKTPNINFPRLWTTYEHPIFDKKEVLKHATADDPWVHDWVQSGGAAGFGPYCLEQWQKGSQMTLTANPNYFKGQPQFKKVIIKKIPSGANRVASIQSGAAQVVTDLTPQEFDSLKNNPDVEVRGYYNTRTSSLIFGFNFDPWKGDKQAYLRQAFAYAVPYQQIIDQAYFGAAKPWYGHVFSAANGYVEDKRYSEDLEKAKALLVKAGYPGGKGLEKFAEGLSLYYPAERASIIEPVATAIRTSLAKIGVNITLHPIPIVEFGDRQLSKHDMGLSIYDFGTPYGADMSYAYNLFYLTAEKGGPINTGAYSNAKTDDLFVKSLSAVGEPRQKLLTEMQDILMTDLPSVPLVEWKQQIAVRKGLDCFVGHPDGGLRYWFITTGQCKATEMLKPPTQ